MKGGKVLSIVLLLICADSILCGEFVFEFGNDEGHEVYNKDGNIPLMQWSTMVDIPVQPNLAVSYVKVTVNSLSPPKVDYDHLYHRVSIHFSWSQVTMASYNVLVKAQ